MNFEGMINKEFLFLYYRVPLHVPTGIASFPHEIMAVLQSLASLYFRNITQFTYMPRGGHFAAFEEPQLMANDIKSFVKAVEKGFK